MTTETELSGWGNYPVERCRVDHPQSFARLRSIVESGKEVSYIPRGLGRSLGDAALNQNQGVIVQTGLNRFLAFDQTTGVLECEAGVSLAEILQHLLPRGWYVATTPGTKFVTIGGAIAADVHGKNHHVDGSFGNAVLSFQLLTAACDEITCSRDQNPDVFWATIGGMGLTGIIVRARVQLRRVPSSFIAVDYRRTKNLDETLECFEATNRQYRYSVAWIDCLSRGGSMGRSVVMLGNDALADDVRRRLGVEPYHVSLRGRKAIPFDFPSYALNSWFVKAFNTLYYTAHPDRQKLVDYDTYFYPLDHIHNWNRLYGRSGYLQFQAMLPLENSRRGMIALLERLTRSRRASFLAVLKSCGPGNAGMLSYLYPGHTLALDIPNRGIESRRLLGELDKVLLEHGGRLYLAKDAVTSPETFAAMYPRLHEFRAIKARIDPNCRFLSSQARRLRIVEKG
jgi:decaprenylphospho-beta-D-ribofuranose 2-oxidase